MRRPPMRPPIQKHQNFPSQITTVGNPRKRPRSLFGVTVLEFSVVFSLSMFAAYTTLLRVWENCLYWHNGTTLIVGNLEIACSASSLEVDLSDYLTHSFPMFGVNIVVQFYHWFEFYFLLFQTHYHTLPYPKAKEKKISTEDKIEPQHMIYYASQRCEELLATIWNFMHSMYVTWKLLIVYSL